MKVVRFATGLGLRLPNEVCRELKIIRGEYFKLVVKDIDTLIFTRVRVAEFGNFEEARDKELDILEHE